MEVSVLTCLVASCSWHVYGKTAWQTPKKGQKLLVKREEDKEALIVDEYSVAWMMKSKVEAHTEFRSSHRIPKAHIEFQKLTPNSRSSHQIPKAHIDF